MNKRLKFAILTFLSLLVLLAGLYAIKLQRESHAAEQTLKKEGFSLHPSEFPDYQKAKRKQIIDALGPQPDWLPFPPNSMNEESRYYSCNEEIEEPSRLSPLDKGPLYPPVERHGHFTFIARLYISKEGRVVFLEPLKRTPYLDLDRWLLGIMKETRFKPARKKISSDPINCLYILSIEINADRWGGM